jgi:hypothetical protein
MCDAFFAVAPVVVWKASRAMGGKTMEMAALALAEAVTLHASVSLLGGSGEQSARVHEYLVDFWSRPAAPVSALATDATGRRTTLIWGNKVTALMASMAAVSGPHPQRLRIDEVDLVDLKLLDQALGQPMSKGGVEAQVVLSSAHYMADGTLTEVLKRAAEKGWPVHEWCYRECLEPHGWLARSEVARTQNIVTKAMWDVQYDLQEPEPEGRAIDPAKVERMFVGPLIPATGEEFHYREFEPPVEGATYATGADWARVRDFVEIVTLRDDVLPLRLVAYQRFRKKPTPYILAQFEHQTGRYPGSSAHDATGGGGYIDDFLAEPTEPFVMVGLRRRSLFTDYIVSIEHEEIVSPRIEVLYRQHKFCRNLDLWSPAGHPPDGVVAGALSHHASTGGTKPLRLVGSDALPPGVRRAGLPAEAPAEPATGLSRALDMMGPGNGHGGDR